MEQTSGISLEPPERKRLNKATVFMACITVLAIAAAVTFAILWATKKPTTAQEESNPTPCPSEDPKLATSSPEYIYIGQWGIKIKVPDQLKNLHYSYKAEGSDKFEYSDGNIKIYDHPSSVEISGTDGEGDGVSPSFIGSALGSVSRYQAGSYDCNASCPTYITTLGNYEYYYTHPQAVTTQQSDEIEWETSSVKLIENALSAPENYSVF